MAEEPKPQDAEGGEAESGPKRAKSPKRMAAAALIVIALGSIAALVAVPSKQSVHRFHGPFNHSLFEEKFNTNLKDNQQRRYLQTLLDCMYFAYSETYLAERAKDPLYEPMLRDAVGRTISDRTLQETYEGPNREVFLEALRDVLNPILFPLHIGDTTQPMQLDEDSGLRPGISFNKATFRGRFWDHVLHVNAPAKTLCVDDGLTVTFLGDEEDLFVGTETGESIFVDVSEIVPDFVGDVHIGVHGRIRQLFARELIAQ
jgi:flagellar basal body-associated protein FliL